MFWPDRAVLSVHEGLLLKGTWLVIPSVMRNKVLRKLHEGHQGRVRCKERAKESVWWPGINKQLSDLIINCKTCMKERTYPVEPLLPS